MQHWDHQPEPDDTILRAVYLAGDVGYCKKAANNYEFETVDHETEDDFWMETKLNLAHPDTKALAVDCEMYYAALETKADFGCVMGEISQALSERQKDALTYIGVPVVLNAVLWTYNLVVLL